MWEALNMGSTKSYMHNRLPNSSSHLYITSPIDQPYVLRGYAANVYCKGWSLFVGGKYRTSMNATCGNYSAWETPKHKCTFGCSFYSYLFQIAPGQQTASRYTDGTTLKVICRSGRIYYLSPLSYFISNAEIVCKGYGRWKMENVSCWKDQIVDFNLPTKTFQSHTNTASPMTSHNVKITIGETVFQNRVAAWGAIVITSKLNQVKAVCEVFNSSELVVKKSSTILNVQFLPEFVSEDLRFGMQKAGSGRAIIEFKANPRIASGDIQVTKNNTLIQNYYLSHEEFNHRVIVDFPKLSSEPTEEPITASQCAGITIGVVIGIALAVFIAFMSKKAWDKYKTTESAETSNTVEYNTEVPPEHHNYEDIKDKQEESELDNDSVHDTGYVNVNFQGSNSRNVNTGIEINTANANRKVALKPPTNRESQVAQSSDPYELPTAPKWR